MLLVLFYAVQARKKRYAMNKRMSFFRLYRVSCIQSVSCESRLIADKIPPRGKIYHGERECVCKSDSKMSLLHRKSSALAALRGLENRALLRG